MTDDRSREEAEFRALVERELLDENLKPSKAANLAASAEADDRSDAGIRRVVQSLLAAVPSTGFMDGSAQRQSRYLRELRQEITKEREASGNSLQELDRRLSQESELDRRTGLMRRN